MLRTTSACLFLFIIFCIAGCNKKVTVQQKVFSRAMLTAHPWKIKTLLYRKEDDTANSDLTNSLYHDCELDDKYIFGSDSTFIRDDNIIKCGVSALFGPYGQGSWTGNSDLTELTIYFGAFYSINFTVAELTETSFIMEQATTDVFQNEIVYTYKFEPAD